MSGFRSILLASLASILIVLSARTQTNSDSSSFTSFAASPGKPIQLGYYASAKKDCTPASLPTVRVIEAPRFGTMTVRKAVLQTDQVKGCPALKTPAQVVFYLARPGEKRTDHLIYQVTNTNGETGTYDVTIEISATENSAPRTQQDKI